MLPNHAQSKPEPQEFWETQHQDLDLYPIELQAKIKGFPAAAQDRFLTLLGNLEGKSVLEIGCGNGAIATYLAKKGAAVTAIDLSSNATQQTKALAQHNGVGDRVNAFLLNALEIHTINQTFDLIVGKYILHHIEPFNQFAQHLSEALQPDGKAVFIENNARNPILMAIRGNLVGKFGIPKMGDDQEYPFEPGEVDLLEQYVGPVNLHFPDLIFFRMINTYIFRHQQIFKPIMKALVNIDQLLYRLVPSLHQYSYLQIVEVTKRPLN
jgi:2-polyprenyl-3-methyl-5-hydroxy-6-metoxy-1,4-benzoquinol methylase